MGLLNKIGILIDSFKLGVMEGIKKSAELGVDGVQFYAVDGEMAPENLSKVKRKELLDHIKSHGLVVSAICGDIGGHGFSIKEDNKWKIEKSRRIIELAKELECHIVTTHLGVIPETRNSNYEILLEASYKLGEFAESIESVFAIETGPEKTETLKGFLDELNSKGVGVNYDPANLVMVTGDDPVKGVHVLKDYIVHTHAKDGVMIRQGDPEGIYKAFAEPEKYKINFKEYFTETSLGKGNVDFTSYLQGLKSINYSGFLTIEREISENIVEDIRKDVKFLKLYANKH